MKALGVAAAAALLTACSASGSVSSPPATSGPAWPVVYRTPDDVTDSGFYGAFELQQGQAWLGGACSGDVQSVEVAVVSRLGNVVVDGQWVHGRGRSGLYFDVPSEFEYEIRTTILGDVRCRFDVRQR